MSKGRELALDSAFVLARLLDKRYWDDVVEALDMSGTKGFERFEKACKSARIPKNMISPTWKGLIAYKKEEADLGIVRPCWG
jgi:hypothetical protein